MKVITVVGLVIAVGVILAHPLEGPTNGLSDLATCIVFVLGCIVAAFGYILQGVAGN